MSRWALLVLVACEKGKSPPPPQPPAVARVAIDAARPELPPPWREVPEPTQDQLLCGNRADSWTVSADAKGVHVAKQTVAEPDTGPALPFKPRDLADGRRHTLAVRDGFLVGIDGGEFGGSLDWFSADGKQHASLGKPNVKGLASLGADEALVLTGLNHLGVEEGTALWLASDAKGWHETANAPLDGGPEAFVDAGDAVYAVTPSSLVRIGRDHKVEVVSSQPTGVLYPDSMAADAQHSLWIGMRGYVVKIDRSGKVTWYADATPCASSE
jgi:hypothetical protein